MSTLAAKQNLGLDLSKKIAVVVGGTQGIGAATALRFAKAGAGVYIVGRNPVLGNSVLEELKKVGKEGAEFEFIQADLSLIKNVKEVVTTLETKTKDTGINYLVQTQGGPPNGIFQDTTEGHDSHFAIQVLSRFGISYLLAKSGTLKESYVTVCAPKGDQPPDLPDLELRETSAAKKSWFANVVAAANRDSRTTDALISEFNAQFPSITAYHVLPGIVTTSAAANQGLPWPLVWAFTLFSPLLSRTIGNSPQSYADIPVFLAANPKSKELGEGLRSSNEKLKEIRVGWVEGEEGRRRRREVWDRVVEIGEF